MINTIVDLTTESERKQLRVSESTYNYVKDKSNQHNKTCTKGIFVYELILTVETDRESNFDIIDEHEERIDEKLKTVTSPKFLEKLNNLKYSKERRDRIDKDTTKGDYSLNLHIPKHFDTEILPNWGSNDYIMQKVIEYKINPFRSRKHRIKVKEDIINFVENNSTPAVTDIAIAVINDDNTKISVSELHNMVNNIESKKNYMNIGSIEELNNWWDKAEDSDNIKDSEKYQALGYCVENMMENGCNTSPKSLIESILTNIFRITTSHYRKQKVNEIMDDFDLDRFEGYDSEVEKFIVEKGWRSTISTVVTELIDDGKISVEKIIAFVNNNTSDKYTKDEIETRVGAYDPTFSYSRVEEDGRTYIKEI